MSKWYSKIKAGLPSTPRIFKSEIREGEDKCPFCKKVTQLAELENSFFVCSCGFHYRIGSTEYFTFLFDDASYTELFSNIITKDAIEFKDTVTYHDRLSQARERTELNEAFNVARGKIHTHDVILGVMDFLFIGGSISMAVGEKSIRSIDFCIKNKLPLIIVTRSGGTRLMEANFALMQMVKMAAKLNEIADSGIPFIAVLADPTIGAAASLAMQADFIIAEPDAVIGNASPKVIMETIGRDLPKGFQRSEFLMEHGFVDIISPRNELKNQLAAILNLLKS
jgi:acetyl-CoA carboxylase carboxyl transferase subunit beta